MPKFSFKSVFYLPLMALAIGILPVLMLPPGQIVPTFMTMKITDMQTISAPLFPFQFNALSLNWIVFALLLPIAWMLWALATGKKAYHGLYALFVVMGFMLKAQALDGLSYTLLIVMGVMAAINIMAYLYATGDTFDSWLNHYFGKYKARATATSSYNGPVHHQESNVASNQPDITNRSKIALKNFNHIVGMAEFKERLLNAGHEILSAKTAGASRNGILLTGDPGNGKTTMAEALAGQLNLEIITVSFGDVASMWIGETTQKVMKVFDDAERQAPCLLFIDEVEAILIDRSKVTNADSEGAKTVSAVLKRLESIRNKKIVVVAATNFLDRLDPAAIREGRFDYKLEVPAPDFLARKHLLEAGLKSVTALIYTTGLERAAKRWEGFSVSRIRAIATEVLEQLKSKKIDAIGFNELAQALRNLNATQGDRIPENTLTIDELILETNMRARLNKLANRMINIDEIEAMGGSVPAGVLFHGPAGTGKTIAAMALAKASKWAFLKTSGHDLLHTPQKIDDLMRLAKDIRPCIIFIDEADDVLADRRSSLLSKDVTNKLLSIMDGAGGKTKDILFIAATNAPDLIDEAMLRGGRFTEKVAFDVLGNDALHTYVTKWIANTRAPLADDFKADTVTALLSGQSLANVGEILQSAVNEAISTGETKHFKVDINHLQAALTLIKGVSIA